MKRTALWLGLLAGCGTGLESLSDETGLAQDGEIGITSLDPSWGLPDADTVVTIHGWGFEGDPSVTFGNAALDVTRIDTQTLLVTAPAVGMEIAVDVSIENDLGTVTLPEGFVYANDEPDDTDTNDTDTNDTDTDTQDPTGKIGGLVQFSRIQVACPQCFGFSSDMMVSAVSAFHSPTSAGWLDWQPSVGNCIANPVPNSPSSSMVDVGEWVYLESGSTSVGLRRTTGDSGLIYEGNNLGLEDFISNASYDLSVSDGGDLGDAFDIEDAVQTPQGFTDIQPYQLLLVNPTAAFSAPVRKSGTSFTWSPSGGTGTFVIQIEVYDPSGASYLGSILCHGSDNGGMAVPGTLFTSFPNYSLLAVTMYRQQLEEPVIPANGSTLQAITQAGVLGTAYLSP